MNFNQLVGQQLGLAVLGGFLLGSIPCGYIVGKFYGVDVRKSGSGNIGATNVNRVAGKGAGALTLFLDLMKGLLATYIPDILNVPYVTYAAGICGVCAVIGHCFSPFMGGRGGKGVATALGVFLSLAPLAAILSIFVFLIVAGVSRFVSLGSLAGCWFIVLLLGTRIIGYYPKELFYCGVLVAVIVTIRHQENIRRLRLGMENKL